MASDQPSERHSGALPTAGWLAPQTSGYTGLVGVRRLLTLATLPARCAWLTAQIWLGGPSCLARLQSRLAVDADGCVFAAGHREGAGIALAWPLDYGPGIGPDGVVEIVNSGGEVVLREGDAFAAAGGLTPDDFDSPEKRHARELHGRDMFVIGLPVERLEE